MECLPPLPAGPKSTYLCTLLSKSDEIQCLTDTSQFQFPTNTALFKKSNGNLNLCFCLGLFTKDCREEKIVVKMAPLSQIFNSPSNTLTAI